MSNHPSWQIKELAYKINGISPEAFENLGEIIKLKSEQTVSILTAILEFGCKSQNAAGILAGRATFVRLPTLPEDLLTKAISTAVDLADEWEYRRLLEMLHEADSALLKSYIFLGLGSVNPEVRESARDFLNAKES